MSSFSYALTSCTLAEAQAPAKGAQPVWQPQRLSPPSLRVVVEEGERGVLDEVGYTGKDRSLAAAVLRVLHSQPLSAKEVCLDTIHLHRFKQDDGQVVGLAARVQGCQLQVRWAVSTSPDLYRRFLIAFRSPIDCASFVERAGTWIPTTILPNLASSAAAAAPDSGSQPAKKTKGKRRKTAVEGGKEAECKRPKRTEPVNERVVLTVEESETMLAERPSSAAAVRPTAMSTVLPRVPARSGPQQAQTAQIEAARTTSPVPAPAHERPPVSPPPMLAVSAAVADLIDLDFSDAAAWRPGDANVSEVDPGFFDRLFSSPPSGQNLPSPLRPTPPTPLVDVQLPPVPLAGGHTSIWGARIAPNEPTELDDAALRRLVADVLADEGFLPFVERLERLLDEGG